MIDVYIGGDGGSWSCHMDAVLYRCPTETFDHAMLMGTLNTADDLQQIALDAHGKDVEALLEDVTDVWVQADGT